MISKSNTKRPAAPSPGPSSAAAAAVASRHTRLTVWLVPGLITAIFFAAIFLLPFHVTPPGPNASQSWEFNFNNTTAHELIALLLFSLFGWRLFFNRGDYRHTSVARVFMGEAEPESMRSLWLAMATLQLVNFAILIIWYNILPYTHYGEFTYFIQRIEAMLGGQAPYRDFEFGYGSTMLSAPIFVYNLFRHRLSIEAAYFIVLLFHFAIGYTLLAYLVSQVNIRRGRVTLFLLLAIPFINLTLGVQYTPLRFTIALAAFFAIRQAYHFTVDSPRLRWLLLGLAALLFPFLNFLISVEMGLALLVSLFVYFGWFIFGPERRLALLTIPVVAGVALALFVFPWNYFTLMLSFGKGGASFPIFPTVHILAFLAAAIWIFPQLGVIAIRDKTSAAPFCAGLAILMGLFILPALGRCDPGHVYINSLGLCIIALSATTWLARKWTYTVLAAFAVIFVAMIMAAFWDNYKDPIGNALDARSQLSHIDYTPDNYAALPAGAPLPLIHYSKLLPMADWLNHLPAGKIGIPLGADEPTERYLRLTGRMPLDFHIAPYGGIFGDEELQRKYNDMRSMPFILVPYQFVGYLQPVDQKARMRVQGEADCRFLSGLLLFPVNLPAVHPLFDPNFGIMHRIATDYEVVNVFPDQQHPQMLLLQRK